jgi:hypothetical protein
MTTVLSIQMPLCRRVLVVVVTPPQTLLNRKDILSVKLPLQCVCYDPQICVWYYRKGHVEQFLNLTHNTTLYTVFIVHTKHNIQ